MVVCERPGKGTGGVAADLALAREFPGQVAAVGLALACGFAGSRWSGSAQIVMVWLRSQSPTSSAAVRSTKSYVYSKREQ